jgi:hypothetical protein
MNRITTIAAGVALACINLAHGAVPEPEAKQLGKNLTAVGAEMAGNKDGSIPAYTGGLTTPPANYQKGSGIRPDPFAGEKPLFSIDAQNMDKYADKLTEGVKGMMKKYPSYRIDVYPTHRTQAFPQKVLDNTVKNASRCKTTLGGLALSAECRGGLPFPIAKTGYEAMWNHLVIYSGDRMEFHANAFFMDSSGRLIKIDDFNATYDWPYYNDTASMPEVYSRVRADKLLPRIVGSATILWEYMNPVEQPRRAWSYSPGQRRVRAAPDFSYDTPTDASGGIETYDDITMFSGVMDRYDFKLVGTKEMYIPYNIYKASYETKAEDLFKPNHLNPDKVRWELHRVQVVEGTLKEGKRHVYGKRVYYFDEDKGAAMADIYDLSGKLWRVKLSGAAPSYDIPAANYRGGLTYDLVNGTYYMSSHTAETGGMPLGTVKSPTFFTSSALAGGGIR